MGGGAATAEIGDAAAGQRRRSDSRAVVRGLRQWQARCGDDAAIRNEAKTRREAARCGGGAQAAAATGVDAVGRRGRGRIRIRPDPMNSNGSGRFD